MPTRSKVSTSAVQVMHLETYLFKRTLPDPPPCAWSTCHQSALALLHPLAQLNNQIVHLTQRWPDLNLGIKQASRSDNLFHYLIGFFQLIRPGVALV